ncbi:hypothetical protein KY289_033383 [Solanum tuberosum]|nr:hypothetical protein KY289_033383 [Solanum tuberosum]
MGISSEMRREDSWAKRRESLLIASAYEEDRIRKSRECTQGYKFSQLFFPTFSWYLEE